MPSTRKLIAVAMALAVVALHVVVGPDYRGLFAAFVHGYLIDLLLPFVLFLLLGFIELAWVRLRTTRAALVFAAGALTETLQYWGVPLFGSTFDPLDCLA